MEWNSKGVIAIACFASILVGASQPVFGAFLMSPMLTQLTIPLTMYPLVYPGKDLEDEVNFLVMWMGFVAVATFLSMFVQKLMF